MSGDIFGWHIWEKAKDAAKHSTVHRTGSHNNKLYGQNVNSVKVEKPWFTGDTVIWATQLLILYSSCLSGLSLFICKMEL